VSASVSTTPCLPDVEPVPNDRRLGKRRHRSEAPDASDEALVAGMVAGDDRAAAAFVARHERRVFGIALGITTNRSTAEDVAQEAFVRAWRHAAVFDPSRASATSWLATITRNLAIDSLRAQRSLPVEPDDSIWHEVESRQMPAEAQAEQADAMDRVRAALRTVPVDQRRALMRSAFYGQSASEIAEAESIPLGTAKSRIRLGLTRVRDIVKREGA
jgi:RNA polymerase sigma factor (sigma-70 family)